MKCPNCGFEGNTEYCQMCGCKIPDENQNAPKQENPYISNNQGAYIPNIPNNPGPNIPNSPNHGFASPPPPQNGGTVNGINPTAAPSAPPFESKKNVGSKKALPIVLASILIAVVIAGIAIAIYSAYTYNKSIIEIIAQLGVNVGDPYSDDVELYSDSEISYREDYENHEKGETVELACSEITLVDFKTGKFDEGYTFSDDVRLDVTYKLKNTTDVSLAYNISCFCAYNADGDESEYDDYADEPVYFNNDINNTFITIEPGKTETLTISYAMSPERKAVELTYDESLLYDSLPDFDYENEYTYCRYLIDISQ